MATIQRCLSTSAYGRKSVIRRTRESPKTRPFDAHLESATARHREASKETQRELSPTLIADKGQRWVDSFDRNSLKIIGGRINRKIVKKENIGGSVAATMSATTRYRKANASSRDTLSQGTVIVKNPSKLSIPIVSSKIVNEDNVLPNPNPTNSDSSTMVPMAGVFISAVGIFGYFSLQNGNINDVTNGRLASTKD